MDSSPIKLYRLERVDERVVREINNLLPQLGTPQVCSIEQLKRLVQSPNSALFIAERNDKIMGMLSAIFYDTVATRKAWIEDVVVDSSLRGCGIGTLLVEIAQNWAAERGAESLSLTSSPSRVAAHALYKRCGFSTIETTVFRDYDLK